MLIKIITIINTIFVQVIFGNLSALSGFYFIKHITTSSIKAASSNKIHFCMHQHFDSPFSVGEMQVISTIFESDNQSGVSKPKTTKIPKSNKIRKGHRGIGFSRF